MNKKLKSKIVGVYGTQYKFARAMGIQETIISAVIRGRKDLEINDQKKWARKLNSEPGEIFGRE
jgi:hypothetical protein